jgi:hypothetical protein
MSHRTALSAVALLIIFPVFARAQPFFTPGVSSFTPEIGIVNTGIVSDLSATVSPDRKYVTIGVRAQQSTLLALTEFRINAPQVVGFVGGVQFNSPLQTGAFGAINPPVSLADGRGAAILQQRGMTRIVIK